MTVKTTLFIIVINFLCLTLKAQETISTVKQSDTKFAENGAAQLDWVYKHSVYYEKAHLQYPIYRVL